MSTYLIVDDHGAFRAQARALLEAEGETVVAEVADGFQAIEAAARLAPDVVLLDVGLPGIDGFEVAARLSASARPPAVVLMSSRDAGAYGPRLAASPAAGFVAKDELSAARLHALLSGR